MSGIDRSKPILVFLAAGVQGGAVVRAALRNGFRVRGLVRDRSRVSTSASPDIDWAQGDLDDFSALYAASTGVDHAVLQLPIGPADVILRQTETALAALGKAHIRSLVLKLASASRSMPCEEQSFVTNRAIEDAVRRSRLPFAILRPTMYLDNLLKPAVRREIIERGIFSPPISGAQAIAWTSADDCAVAAIKLLEHGVDGGDHRIAGPESLTGSELALRISAGLGRPVEYHAQPIDEFEREVEAVMGADAGRRVASKFRYFARHPDEAKAILAAPFERLAVPTAFRATPAEEWVRQRRCEFLHPGKPG